jgi:hypothetical protein
MIPQQLPEESTKAYAAFSEYCKLGPERSLAKLRQKTGKTAASKRTHETWSTRFNWQERVTEYDSELAKRAHEAEDQALKDEAAYFAKEIIAHRRQALADSAALRKVALAKLEKLSKATLGDICRALQAADNMKRLALNMATEKTEVSGPDNAPLAIQAAAPVVIVLPENGRDTPKG